MSEYYKIINYKITNYNFWPNKKWEGFANKENESDMQIKKSEVIWR